MNHIEIQPLLPIQIKKQYVQRFIKPNIRRNGYLLLASTWIVFIVGMGALFGLWEIPNPKDSDFPVTNYYSYALMLIPVGLWVWAYIAWVGLKLFKHSKGGATEKK